MIAVNIFLTLMLLQYPMRRMPGGPGVPNTPGVITDAVASFEGKFKSADKKYVTVEVDEGQTMRMYITGSTKFFRDDKQVKASDFHVDEYVTVDASRDMHMNLLAVRVTLSKPKPKQPEPTN